MIELKLAFLQEQEEAFFWNAVIFSKHAFSLVPKVLDAIDVIFYWQKA